MSEKEKYSLCAQALVMPIEMIGQNGAVLRANIHIVPTGCLKTAIKVVTPTRAQKLAKSS